MTQFFVVSSSKPRALAGCIPGIVLVAVITASAYGLRNLPFVSSLSPMITAIFLGMVFANIVGFSSSAEAGISIAGKKLLRLAVAMLGLQLTFAQLASIGITGLVFAAGIVVSTLIFTVWAGRLLGVDRKLSLLLAAGTAICGASAIAGANAVTRARDEDVSYAVACITLFGTIAMFLYPFLNILLGNDPQSYGLWVGLTVHEVAQVVGAGFQGGEAAGQVAIVSKLARVMMLAPVVIALALYGARSDPSLAGRPPMTQVVPFFIVGFVSLLILNSFGFVPEQVRAPIVAVTPVFLTAAMAALGLGTNLTKLKQRGLRPLLLSFLASLYIATAGLLLANLTP
jgi:uncharacterized integral membrane protein (TIGR00698 family)